MSEGLLTIPHILLQNSQNYPSEIAMREKKFGVWKTKTWKEVSEEVKAIAISLESKGIKNDTTIGIIGNNTPRWVIAEIATQALKGVPLGLYADALEKEIEYLLEITSCKVVFVEDEEQADKVMSLNALKDKIKIIVYDEEKGMNKYKDKRLISYKRLLSDGSEILKKDNEKYSILINKVKEDDVCIFCPTRVRHQSRN